MSYFSAAEAAEMRADADSPERRELFDSQPADQSLANSTPGERLALALELSDMALALAGFPIDRSATEGEFWL